MAHHGLLGLLGLLLGLLFGCSLGLGLLLLLHGVLFGLGLLKRLGLRDLLLLGAGSKTRLVQDGIGDGNDLRG